MLAFSWGFRLDGVHPSREGLPQGFDKDAENGGLLLLQAVLVPPKALKHHALL